MNILIFIFNNRFIFRGTNSDYLKDIETINNNGDWGVWYASEDARQNDIDEAKERVEAYEQEDHDE